MKAADRVGNYSAWRQARSLLPLASRSASAGFVVAQAKRRALRGLRDDDGRLTRTLDDGRLSWRTGIVAFATAAGRQSKSQQCDPYDLAHVSHSQIQHLRKTPMSVIGCRRVEVRGKSSPAVEARSRMGSHRGTSCLWSGSDAAGSPGIYPEQMFTVQLAG
jgi:hypothetical protein